MIALFGGVVLYGIALRKPAQGSRSLSVQAGGLVCVDPVWNFGVVDAVKDSRFSHEFVLTNETQGAVKIDKVHSACACVVAEGYKSIVLPGESTELSVDVDLVPVPGHFEKTLVVDVGSDPIARMPLRIVGTIMPNPSLLSTPTMVDFGSVPREGVKERVVQIRRYDNSNVEILDAHAEEGLFECSVDQESSSVPDVALLRVRFVAKDVARGNFSTSIKVRTKHERFQHLRIPVSAIVVEPRYGIVESIVVSDLPAGKAKDVLLRPTGASGAEPRVVSANLNSESGGMQIELVTESVKGPTLRIRRTAESLVPGVFRGTARIRLKDVEHEVGIPILVLATCEG